jgi:hypothetical protein
MQGSEWARNSGRRNTATRQRPAFPPSNAKPLAGVRVTVLPTVPGDGVRLVVVVMTLAHDGHGWVDARSGDEVRRSRP